MALPLPLLLLGVFAVPGGCSDPHLLRYFYTAVFEPDLGLPKFTVVGYLDDQLFFHFDSNTQKAQPRAPWIQAEGSEYWDRQTWIARGWQEAFSGNVRIAMERYNHTGGLHTFQYTYGCELQAGGGTDGFRKYGYDGGDFLFYDIHTHAWVAPSSEALITKAKMESDSHLSQQQRDYLERKCLEWLRKYLDYGQKALQRRERPAVRVTARDTPNGPTTLSCRVHGFYPRHITVSWLRHGENMGQETWHGGTLPNGDGTYHTWATVEINPRERGLYSCHVEHVSLDEPLIAVWEPPPSPAVLLMWIEAVTAALVITVAAGIVLWRRRQHLASIKNSSPPDSNKGFGDSLPASEKGSSSGSDRGYESTSSVESEARRQLVEDPGNAEAHLLESQQLLPHVSDLSNGNPAPDIV